jgi:hypothetical protein
MSSQLDYLWLCAVRYDCAAIGQRRASDSEAGRGWGVVVRKDFGNVSVIY